MIAFRRIAPVCLLAAWLAGCSAPTASVDLIAMGRRGLASASAAQGRSHDLAQRQYKSQAAALDAAFDADVRAAAGGTLRNAAGEPIAMTPEWVISARKGYAAARDLIAQQAQAEQAENAARLDDIQAADEALQMATELILAQWSVSQKLREQFQAVQAALVPGPKSPTAAATQP